MRLVRALLRQSKRRLLLALLVGAAAGTASAGLLALLNAAVVRREIEVGATFFVLFFAVCLLVPITRVGSIYLLEHLGQGVILDLRLRFSQQILATPLRWLETLGSPRLFTVLTEDIHVLSEALVQIPMLAINGTIVLGCMSYLAWLSPSMFLGLLGILAVGVAGYQLALRLGIQRFLRARLTQEDLLSHFRALTEGIKDLKVHDRRRHAFLGLLRGTAEELRSLQVSGGVILGVAASGGHLLLFLVLGGLLLLAPDAAGADPTLVSYMMVLIYMIGPMQVFLDALPRLGRANAAMRRIEELGLTLADHGEEQGGAPPARNLGFREVALDGVVFTFGDPDERHRFALGPLDLVLRAGELTFVIGGNGSGKTTLAKLLTGLYEPDEGRLLVDGVPLTRERLEEYRRRFAVVFSDSFLFDGLLGLDENALDRKAQSYIERLELGDKVMVEDGVFSTTALSQGQRKRLTLLTAYLEDQKIYVFDEWAADQDPAFKHTFYSELLPELKSRGKAVVVISHDDRYYGVADRIIKLESGRIQFDGTAGEFATSTALWLAPRRATAASEDL